MTVRDADCRPLQLRLTQGHPIPRSVLTHPPTRNVHFNSMYCTHPNITTISFPHTAQPTPISILVKTHLTLHHPPLLLHVSYSVILQLRSVTLLILSHTHTHTHHGGVHDTRTTTYSRTQYTCMCTSHNCKFVPGTEFTCSSDQFVHSTT